VSPPRSRRAAAAAGLLLALLAAGCIPFRAGPVKLRGYVLSADPGANGESPVQVDLVVVGEAELAKAVGKLSSAQWFAQKGQLLLDHPRGLEVTSLEPVPGQMLPRERLRLRARKQAAAAFVFANYPAKGDHRVRVDPFPWISIRLTADSLAVAPVRGP
jgi:hypothetical protein